MKINFINHASLIVESNTFKVLTDPWFNGTVFNNGWKLIHETSHRDVKKILNKINYIWISHEHPDHFSVPFFKKYKEDIIKNKINVLFQHTEDKRVKSFLNMQGIEVVELEFNKIIEIEKNVYLYLYKFGFYDSAIIIKDQKDTFLNLNDCPVSKSEMLSIAKKFKNINYVATQFSYAAWKGGIKNIKWRKDAALEKIEIIKNIQRFGKPDNIILFASFSFFSREENYYLNDCWNSPLKIINQLSNQECKIIVASPFECINKMDDKSIIKSAKFWENKHNKLLKSPEFDKIENLTIEDLEKVCDKSFQRFHKNNNITLLKFLNIVSLGKICNSVNFYISDLNLYVKVDLINKLFAVMNLIKADITLKATDFNFLHGFDYGFDTLTVNGCFEENSSNGFKKMILSYSLFSLNNTGLNFGFKIFFNLVIVKKFLELFYKVISKN